MTDLTAGEAFAPRPAPLPDLAPEHIFPAKYHVTVLFHPSCRWRLVEEYGADRFTEEPDGRLRFTGPFPDADSVLSWVLTFGEKAELVEPQELREAGIIRSRKMFGEYGLYCDGIFFAVICDDQLFVKVTPAGEAAFPQLPKAPPYEGAKDYLWVEDVDDRDTMTALTRLTCLELQAQPKKRRK